MPVPNSTELHHTQANIHHAATQKIRGLSSPECMDHRVQSGCSWSRPFPELPIRVKRGVRTRTSRRRPRMGPWRLAPDAWGSRRCGTLPRRERLPSVSPVHGNRRLGLISRLKVRFLHGSPLTAGALKPPPSCVLCLVPHQVAHYGVVALPCRVGDPDRKGKVESAIGHAQARPAKVCALSPSRRGPAHSRSLRRPMGVMRTSIALALMRTLGLWGGRTVYAILMAAAFSRPSSVTLSSRIKNFWTLPVTVMGKASTKRT